MTPLRKIKGRAYRLGLDNVDTDLIVPARHLKTLTRAGLGRHAFETLRQQRDNVFDDPAYDGASILIAGANFGCGSSREHAAWALADLGIRAVVARSFSDIFAGNAFKNGIATIELEQPAIDRLMRPGSGELSVDLERMTIEASDGCRFPFVMDGFRRTCLMDGVDEIDLTLAHEQSIAAFERERAF